MTHAQFNNNLSEVYSYEIKELVRGERLSVGAWDGANHVVLRWAPSGNNDQRFSVGCASGKILFRTLREDVHDRTVIGISPTGAAVTWRLDSNWRQSADPGQLFEVEWQPDGQTFALREGTKGEFLSVTSGGGAVRWSGVDGKNEKPKPDHGGHAGAARGLRVDNAKPSGAVRARGQKREARRSAHLP